MLDGQSQRLGGRLQGVRHLVTEFREPLGMLEEQPLGLGAGQLPHIGNVDLAVARQVQPQSPHGVNGDAIFRRPARIVGIIHIPAFAGHDLFRNLAHALHRRTSMLNHQQAVKSGLTPLN